MTIVSPELIVGLGAIFVFMGIRGLAEWVRNPSDRPLIFWRLGRTGELLHRSIKLTIVFGGLVLAVWGFLNASWYVVLASFFVAWLVVQMMCAFLYVEAFITSAFGPLVSSLGILALLTVIALSWLS